MDCVNTSARNVKKMQINKNKYYNDIFYDVNSLKLSKKIEIIEDAYSQNYKWWADKLDCNESFSRHKIEMSFNDVMKKFNDEAHFVVIHRRGYENNRNNDWSKWRLEVGFRTMGGVDYFLWINCDEDLIEDFINKHNLEEL